MGMITGRAPPSHEPIHTKASQERPRLARPGLPRFGRTIRVERAWLTVVMAMPSGQQDGDSPVRVEKVRAEGGGGKEVIRRVMGMDLS